MRDVNALAEKYFKGADSAAKRSWIDGQLKSYDAINAIVPDIPIQVFGAIKDGAVSADSGDWSVARRRILAQIDGYKRAESIGRAMNRDAFEFSSRIVQSLYPDDYVAQARELRAWGGLCDSIGLGRKHIFLRRNGADKGAHCFGYLQGRLFFRGAVARSPAGGETPHILLA